jgi:hypothetical protein
MQMVKIHIPERSDRAKALETLTLRGRVICLPDNIFIVPEPALEVLQSLRSRSRNWSAEDSTMRKGRYEILLPVTTRNPLRSRVFLNRCEYYNTISESAGIGLESC